MERKTLTRNALFTLLIAVSVLLTALCATLYVLEVAREIVIRCVGVTGGLAVAFAFTLNSLSLSGRGHKKSILSSIILVWLVACVFAVFSAMKLFGTEYSKYLIALGVAVVVYAFFVSVKVKLDRTVYPFFVVTACIFGVIFVGFVVWYFDINVFGLLEKLKSLGYFGKISLIVVILAVALLLILAVIANKQFIDETDVMLRQSTDYLMDENGEKYVRIRQDEYEQLLSSLDDNK